MTAILALYAAAGLLELLGVLCVGLEVRRSLRDARQYRARAERPTHISRMLDRTAPQTTTTWLEIETMASVMQEVLRGRPWLRLTGAALLVAGIVVGTCANALSATR